MSEQNNPETYTAPSGDYVMQPDGVYRYVPNQPSTAAPAKKEKKHHGKAVLALTMTLCVLLSGLSGFGGTMLAAHLSKKNQPAAAAPGSVMIPTITKEEGLSTAELAAKVKPSVVEITTEGLAGNGFITQLVESGAGSGVVWSEDGYIVTNHHVIENADQVTVRLADGTSYEAKYVGSDKETDISVIKIKADGLTPVALGDSDALTVGQDIIAVGNPLGQLGGTVTNGIISALDRDVTLGGQTMRLLQTNAAINPGNSGGGLFDAAGRLVGIVNAKSGGNNIEGLGFAIPVNTVSHVANDLIDKGYVSGRISVGVTLLNIQDPATAMSYGVDKYGVYVYSVQPDSSAELAGLASGDRITAVNGEEVADSSAVKDRFNEIGVGNMAGISLVRDGKEKTISLKLTEAVPDNRGKEPVFHTRSAF